VPEERSTIVIVTGLPGTGKSSIGRHLAEDLGWPFISKDEFKERIFDGLGWSDQEWSHKVSATVHRIIDYLVDEELRAGHSFVLESNFKRDLDSERFEDLRSRFPVDVVQVICWAEGDVLFERYKKRMEEDDDRHPGHAERLDEAREMLSHERCPPLDVESRVIEIDTTDLDAIDPDALVEQIVGSKGVEAGAN
jgi:predicted kinase